MIRTQRHRRRKSLPLLPRLAAVALSGWAIAAIATGDHLMIVRLGLYAAPVLLILACMLAALAAVWRSRLTALAMLGVAAGLFAAQAPPLMRTLLPEKPATGEDLLHVVSLSNRTLNLDTGPTARLIRAEDADVFILQEVAMPEDLITAVDQLSGPVLHHCFDGTYVVFSKFPLSAPLPDVWTGMMACEAHLPTGPTWVGSVHLPRGVTSRAEQDRVMDHLLALFEEMPGPKIIAGDFNATPLASPIRRMKTRLDSAFAQAGKGFGFTFPTPARRIGFAGPFLRIDYIFHSEDYRTVSASVLKNHPPFADHFPIRAILHPVGGS